MNVLFVCRANRGRSQMAATLFKIHAPKGSNADSAGTLVEAPGDTLEQRAKVSVPQSHVITLMKEKGRDISQEKQTPVTPEMLNDYQKIVVMAEEETIPDWLKADEKYEYWKIADPRWNNIEDVRVVRDEIEQKVLGLIRELNENRAKA